jgi:hypothetical protein
MNSSNDVNCRGNKKALSAEKMAHILTGAVRGFKLVAKSATESFVN